MEGATNKTFRGLERRSSAILRVLLRQIIIKTERMGVVWAEFVTTSVDFPPTSKLN